MFNIYLHASFEWMTRLYVIVLTLLIYIYSIHIVYRNNKSTYINFYTSIVTYLFFKHHYTLQTCKYNIIYLINNTNKATTEFK